MCSLKTFPAPANNLTAPGGKVTMRCTQPARRTLMLPSMCWADKGTVVKPSASCTQNKTSKTI